MVASKVLAAGGPFLLLTVLPGLYLIFGFALCSACVLTAQIVQPKLSAHRPITVHSANYARWWTVCIYSPFEDSYLHLISRFWLGNTCFC